MKCQALTANDEPCKRNALAGHSYCIGHLKMRIQDLILDSFNTDDRVCFGVVEKLYELLETKDPARVPYLPNYFTFLTASAESLRKSRSQTEKLVNDVLGDCPVAGVNIVDIIAGVGGATHNLAAVEVASDNVCNYIIVQADRCNHKGYNAVDWLLVKPNIPENERAYAGAKWLKRDEFIEFIMALADNEYEGNPEREIGIKVVPVQSM